VRLLGKNDRKRRSQKRKEQVMKASTHNMHRLGKLLVAALAVAAIAVPNAAARTDMGMGRVDADVWGVSEYAQPGPAVKGENYYARGLATQAPGSAQPCRWCPRQSYDVRGFRFPTHAGLISAATVSSSTDFQWADAGIGAGIALGLTALAGGAVLVVRRQRGQLKTS
jgi:hypothetical protein